MNRELAIIIISVGAAALMGAVSAHQPIKASSQTFKETLPRGPLPLIVASASPRPLTAARPLSAVTSFVFEEAAPERDAKPVLRAASQESAQVLPVRDMKDGPPHSLVRRFGNRAADLWKDLEKTPLEQVMRNSLGLRLGAAEQRSKDQGQGTLARGALPMLGRKARIVTWRFLESCPPEDSASTARPPKLSGFQLSAYDEHRNVLRRAFVAVTAEDPYGCLTYAQPLSELLPGNVPPETFSGWVSVSALTLDSLATGEPLWRNFSAPRSLSVEESLGPGYINIAFDPPLTRAFDEKPIGPDEISHFRIYYGESPRMYTHVQDLRCKSDCVFRLRGLRLGTWYFVMTTVDTDGLESDMIPESTFEPRIKK